MNHLFDITHLLAVYGYPGIFVMIFLESGLFFALPGDSLLFAAGLLSGTYGMSLLLLVTIVFLAAFLGSLVGYGIGMYLESLKKYRFFRTLFKQKYIDKAHIFFEKYGRFTFIVSRFVPVIRTFVPIVAGLVGVPFVFFVEYSAVGAALWSCVVICAGYFLGRLFPVIGQHLWIVSVCIIIVSLIPIFIELIKKERS